MRIEIKTKGKVTNPDIRALYLLIYALDYQSTPRMRKANLQFVADRMGYKLELKPRESGKLTAQQGKEER